MTGHPITAVVITFHYPQYLRKCLDSLLAQTQPINIIVVYVAGDIQTWDILDQYQREHEQISLVESKYACIPHQMNLGFLAVKSEFAFLVGSDDIWLPCAAEYYLQTMQKTGAVVVYPTYYLGDATARPGKTVRIPPTFNRALLDKTCYITDVSCVRMSAFRPHLPMSLQSGWSFIWEIWKAVCDEYPTQIVHLPEPVFIYRKHSDSESQRKKSDPTRRHTAAVLGRPPEGYDWPVVPPAEWGRRTVVYTQEPGLLKGVENALRHRKVLVDWRSQREDPELMTTLPNYLHLRAGDVTAHHDLTWWLYNDEYNGQIEVKTPPVGPPAVWTRSVKFFANYIVPMLGAEEVYKKITNQRWDRGLIFGCYADNAAELDDLICFVSRVRRCVIMFLGWDIVLLQRQYSSLKSRYDTLFDNAVVAVDGGRLSQRKISRIIGCPVAAVPLPPPQTYPLRPIPSGQFEIASRQSPVLPQKYYLPLMLDAARALPDVVFHFHHCEGFPAKRIPRDCPGNVRFHQEPIRDMDGFLSQISCAVRFTDHDTFSMCSIETMMAGRPVIGNSLEMPYVIRCEPTLPDLLEAIGAVREGLKSEEGDSAGVCRRIQEASNYYHHHHSPDGFRQALDRLWATAPPVKLSVIAPSYRYVPRRHTPARLRA